MGRDRLPHVGKKCQPYGEISQRRHFKRPLDCWWDRSRSGGLKSCKLYDYGEDDNEV